MEINPIQNISLKFEVRRSLKKIVHLLVKEKKTQLPGEHELAEKLGVSRITVRDVLTEMEQEGIIYKIQGKGTFINMEAMGMKVTLSPAVEFGQAIEKNGYESSVELVEVTVDSGEARIRKGLRLDEEDRIVCAKKIFYADGMPVIYCEDFFAESLIGGGIREGDLAQSTFEYLLEHAGIIVTHDIVQVKATTSAKLPDHGQLYRIVGDKPLLLLESVYYTAKNKPVMHVDAFMDTEYVNLSLLRRQDVYLS